METEAWDRLKSAALRFELDTGYLLTINAKDKDVTKFTYKTSYTEMPHIAMRGLRTDRPQREVAQSLPHWSNTGASGALRIAPTVHEPTTERRRDDDDDDVDFDYVSENENELDFGEEDHDDGLLAPPVQGSVRIRSGPQTDRNDNVACSAPVTIGTPFRERVNEEEFVGSESYWGSALHKHDLAQQQQRGNFQN